MNYPCLKKFSFNSLTISKTQLKKITIFFYSYVCGGALLFSRWEDWKFLDGSYFCFISLSTIGFGDIVPGASVYKSEVIQLSFILTAVYLMLGMALIAMCFNLMQEEVVHKTRSCIKKCKSLFYCCTRRKNPPERWNEMGKSKIKNKECLTFIEVLCKIKWEFKKKM